MLYAIGKLKRVPAHPACNGFCVVVSVGEIQFHIPKSEAESTPIYIRSLRLEGQPVLVQFDRLGSAAGSGDRITECLALETEDDVVDALNLVKNNIGGIGR